MAYDWKTELPGIFSHHADSCPARDGTDCTCGPLGYRASIRDWSSNERIVSPTLPSVYEAVDWQRERMAGLSPPTPAAAGSRGELAALIDEYAQALEDGMVRTESGARYTRESVRGVRGALSYVDAELGTMKVDEVRRRNVQALLDQLRAAEVPPARVAGVIDALNGLYAYAIRREIVGFSPIVELDAPELASAPPVKASTNGSAPDLGWPTGEHWAPPPQVDQQWPPPAAEPTQAAPQWTPPPQVGPPQVGPPWTPPPQPGPQQWTPPPQPGQPWTPQPFPGGYGTPYPTWYPPPQQQRTTGPMSAILGSPGGAADADYDSTMQERWLWWTVRIVVIVFVLIALVLVAESV